LYAQIDLVLVEILKKLGKVYHSPFHSFYFRKSK
jgi:hypothetical protein